MVGAMRNPGFLRKRTGFLELRVLTRRCDHAQLKIASKARLRMMARGRGCGERLAPWDGAAATGIVGKKGPKCALAARRPSQSAAAAGCDLDKPARGGEMSSLRS